MKRLFGLLIVAALGCIQPAYVQAQELSCDSSDDQCLSSRHTEACMSRTLATYESCREWADRLESVAANDGSPTASVYLGLAYSRLKALTNSTSETNRYNDLAYRTFRTIVQLSDSHPDPQTKELYRASRVSALLGLTTHTTDMNERESAYRRIIEEDPTAPAVHRFLAEHLLRQYPDRGHFLAAEVYEQEYEGTQDHLLRKWMAAESAINNYTRAEEQERANILRGRVREDLNLVHRLENLSRVNGLDFDCAQQSFSAFCSGIVSILGEEICLEAISVGAESLRGMPVDEVSERLADVILNGMKAVLMETGWHAMLYLEIPPVEEAAKAPDWLADIRESADFIAEHLNRAKAYEIISFVSDFESPTRIEALEKAAELDPDNGEYRYRLGLHYLARGRRAEALNELNRALALGTLETSIARLIQQIESE